MPVAYDDNKTFASITNLKYFVVKDFVLEPEVSYTKCDSAPGDNDNWAGILCIRRVF